MIFNYRRVSTLAQSTERQLLDIPCDREYEDKVSGKNLERPQLQAMLGSLRESDLINCHDMSRLARNTQDLLSVVDSIVSKGASIKFHKENLTFEGGKQSEPFQKLMLTLMGALSSFERDILLQRQREGIALAKEKGKYKGRPSKFNDNDIADIKVKFKASPNKAELARDLGITRAYLYRLVRER